MNKRHKLAYLEDILESAKHIITFLEKKEFEEFDTM